MSRLAPAIRGFGVTIVICMLGVSITAVGQTVPAKAPGDTPVTAAATDAPLDAAEALIGRALFLRGFPQTNDLNYDAAGHSLGPPKTGDWTQAGIDVKKAERKGPKEIQIEGVRVAIRYNTDNHQFERHPQNDEKMKLLIADACNPHAFAGALDTIFAQGIDPRLQASMPAFWQHYFNPSLAWPQDALTGKEIAVLIGQPAPNSPANQSGGLTPPVVLHKQDARMTDYSQRDKVQGTVQMRLVIDAAGVPQRIAIARSLGYGLDERAVESVAKWRFTPAMRDGQPVAVTLIVNYDFKFVAPPHP